MSSCYRNPIRSTQVDTSEIESTKTTSMEDVSTRVLEKMKNIYEVKIKPKNDMMYQDIYNCICQKKWRYAIQYVKPTAQLVFKNRFPKVGPTCRRQVVNPRHQTSTISCKAWNSPAEYLSWVARCDIKGSESIMLNPIFWKKVQGQKHPHTYYQSVV